MMLPAAKKINSHNLEGQGWPLDNGISELSRAGRPHAKVFASSMGLHVSRGCCPGSNPPGKENVVLHLYHRVT